LLTHLKTVYSIHFWNFFIFQFIEVNVHQFDFPEKQVFLKIFITSIYKHDIRLVLFNN